MLLCNRKLEKCCYISCLGVGFRCFYIVSTPGNVGHVLDPGRLTWNQKMEIWKMFRWIWILQGVIWRTIFSIIDCFNHLHSLNISTNAPENMVLAERKPDRVPLPAFFRGLSCYCPGRWKVMKKSNRYSFPLAHRIKTKMNQIHHALGIQSPPEKWFHGT